MEITRLYKQMGRRGRKIQQLSNPTRRTLIAVGSFDKSTAASLTSNHYPPYLPKYGYFVGRTPFSCVSLL
jgi:hypothetical protein